MQKQTQQPNSTYRLVLIVSIHFNWPIVQFADRLQLDVVAVHAVATLARQIVLKIFRRYKRRIVRTLGVHVPNAQRAHSVVHVGVAVDLQRNGAKQTVAVEQLHNT